MNGWGKGGNVTSAGLQLTVCDPIWDARSRIGEADCQLQYPVKLRFHGSSFLVASS